MIPCIEVLCFSVLWDPDQPPEGRARVPTNERERGGSTRTQRVEVDDSRAQDASRRAAEPQAAESLLDDDANKHDEVHRRRR